MDSDSRAGAGGSRRLLGDAAHLSALWGLAVVQPTFGLLADGDNPAYFFVGRRITGLAFVAVVVAFVLLPLLLAVALEALAARIGERARRRLHLVLVWALFSLLILYALERVLRSTAESPNGAVVLIVLSAVGGVLPVLLYARWEPLQSILTVLSPFPLLSMLLFLFGSGATGLVFGEGEEAEALPAAPSQTPVVMVLFDELPTSTLMDARGRIDAERFPNFAALAGDGIWFKNTVSAADDSVQAVPAILTSKLPERGDAPVHTAEPRSLFTAFGASHRVEAMEHVTWLCPPSVCPERDSILTRMFRAASALSLVYPDVIIPEGLYAKVGVGMPDIGRTWGEAVRPERPERTVQELIDVTKDQPVELNRYADAQFSRFLQLVRSTEGGRAPFYMLHSSLPHVPWVHLPNGRVYAPIKEKLGGIVGNEQWADAPLAVQHAWQRHLLQARFADRALGDLLRRLRREGLYDDALVVLTADHGTSFVPGANRRFVSAGNAADVAMVPFILKRPGQSDPAVEERGLQSMDILPTVADALGVRLPWRLEGRSALRPGPGRREVVISSFLEQTHRTTVAALVKQRAETLRRQAALFGTGLDGGGGFGVGAHRGLVGRPLADLDPRPGKGSVRLYNRAEFTSVDPRSRYVPAARTYGLVETAAPVVSVAVALNGRIAGVAPASPGEGVHGFSAMLDHSLLRPGRNEVSVFAVTGAARAPDLRSLAPVE